MKTLILLRHGKSDWSGNVPDHDRPINHRGRLSATRMAEWIAETVGIPDRLLVSSATRTQETADRLGEVWGDVVRESHGALYLADPETILDTVRGVAKGDRVLLLGHNPGIERAVVQFANAPCPTMMPTCTAAVLRFGVARWADVGFGMGALLHHVTPKSLE